MELSLHLQGCSGEAPRSLRQPHPSDYIHVSHSCWGVNLPVVCLTGYFSLGEICSNNTLSLTFSAMSGKER